MNANVRRVQYFYSTVQDQPGEAYQVLSHLAGSGVNLLAFNATPTGHANTQLMIFPESVDQLMQAAGKTGLVLSGPQSALLIQGDDKLGALVEIHRRLTDAGVNVYSSSGVTDSRGGFGYVVYVRHQDFEEAARSLGV